MIILDFRNWELTTQTTYLPNTKKELLEKEFQKLRSIQDFTVVKSNVKASLSDLFFKNSEIIAVSPVKHLEQHYELLDTVLEIEDKEVVDYTKAAEEEVYFYGSNSLVSHKESEIALCGVNANTDESLFEEYCEDFEMNPFVFDLPDNLMTSDVAFFANDKLLMYLGFVKDKKVKKQLVSLLKSNKIDLVNFTKEQVEKGVLNAKILGNGKLVITQKAYSLFTENQKEAISEIDLEVVEFPFLEEVGVKLKDILL